MRPAVSTTTAASGTRLKSGPSPVHWSGSPASRPVRALSRLHGAYSGPSAQFHCGSDAHRWPDLRQVHARQRCGWGDARIRRGSRASAWRHECRLPGLCLGSKGHNDRADPPQIETFIVAVRARSGSLPCRGACGAACARAVLWSERAGAIVLPRSAAMSPALVPRLSATPIHRTRIGSHLEASFHVRGVTNSSIRDALVDLPASRPPTATRGTWPSSFPPTC